jgi:hypothetical protein
MTQETEVCSHCGGPVIVIRLQADKIDAAAIVERIKQIEAAKAGRNPLVPLDFKPHPYCGCEHCTENYYPDGSPRHNRSGTPIEQGAQARGPHDLQARFDALASYVRSFGGDVDAIIESKLRPHGQE